MNKTKIDWCDSSFNPTTGCIHGCEFCYARKIAMRFDGHFKPTLHTKRLKEGFDSLEKSKVAKSVFVGSMTDILQVSTYQEENTDDIWSREYVIDYVFNSCICTNKIRKQKGLEPHDFIFLTKTLHLKDLDKFDQNNIYIGVSIIYPYGNDLIDQKLVEISENTKNFFISFEPLYVRGRAFNELSESMKKLIKKSKVNIVGIETGNNRKKEIPDEIDIARFIQSIFRLEKGIFLKESVYKYERIRTMAHSLYENPRYLPWRKE